jgi:hypothetical protein
LTANLKSTIRCENSKNIEQKTKKTKLITSQKQSVQNQQFIFNANYPLMEDKLYQKHLHFLPLQKKENENCHH